MTYGITGNPNKDLLWQPVAELIGWMLERDIGFKLHRRVAEGLLERDLVAETVVQAATADRFGEACDIVLSFGGDGTLLNTAAELGSCRTPILGVNVGRLGFLTAVEAHSVRDAIGLIEKGEYDIEERVTLEARVGENDTSMRALNEILVTRTGSVQMIEIEVKVDGALLNRYWADGLIVATSTGSTAYSLSVGGPIVVPGSGVVVVAPVAPHTLTMRPIILPDNSILSIRVISPDSTYMVAADGHGRTLQENDVAITVLKSPATVNFVKLNHWNYFETLRKKLAWGAGGGDPKGSD